MLNEKVIISVDADGDGLRKIATEAKQVNKALKGVDTQSKKTGSSLAQNAELAERMRAALGPLGDVLGDVTGGLDDTMTALDGFSASQVAATAIVVAAIASMFKFAGAIVETITSIDDMAEALRERGDPELNHAVSSVEKLNNKLTDLGVTYDAQWVLLTTKFTPALGGLVTIADFLIPKFGELSSTALDLSVSMTSIGSSIALLGSALGVVEQLAEQADAADRLGFSITELDENFVALKDEFGLFAQSDEFEGSFFAVSDAVKDTKDALKASKDAAAEYRREMKRLAREAKEADKAQKEANKRFLSADTVLKDVSESAGVGGLAFSEMFAEVHEKGKEAKDAVDGMSKVTLAEVEEALHATGAVVTSIGDIYNMVADERIKSAKEGSKEQKKLLKEQFAVNKAFAIVDATIATALASIQAFNVGNPIVGAVLAAAVAATGAAQIAVIAAQQPPSFHRGGMLPDEQASFGGTAITRQNEAGVVFTAQGQRSFSDAINAMNRGDTSRGGGITVMLDSQPIRGVVTQMGQADPAYGHRRRF